MSIETKECNWCGKEVDKLFCGICERCDNQTPEEQFEEECGDLI